jgi:predicted transcriptional regulator
MSEQLGGTGAVAPLYSWRVALRDPRRAIAEHEVVCLVCGASLRHLTNTHLAGHGLTPVAYKSRVGYNLRRALMCRALVRLYAERAVRTGLASFIRHRPILEDATLGHAGGLRAIAPRRS